MVFSLIKRNLRGTLNIYRTKNATVDLASDKQQKRVRP